MNKIGLFLLMIFFLNGEEKFLEEKVETHHKLKLGTQEIPFTATAGKLILKDKSGKPKASMFYVSYIKEGVKNGKERPITFCFNGGPGCASIWLNIGLMGPKRVELNKEGRISPPYDLKDNEYSLLDLTDLVFIDPVSTGFSKTAPGEDPKQYHGVEEDIQSVSDFIVQFTNEYKKWDAPKYLAGESYGTTRAAGLALKLHDDESYYLDGLILISSLLDYQTIRNWVDGNDLSLALYLPSYTACAWYHQKLETSLEKDLHEATAESEKFALNEYPLALMKGDLLSLPEKKAVAKKMARLTGLSEEYIEQNNLRVPIIKFAKELLRKEKRVVGRFDSRFVGIEMNPCGEHFESDPSADAVFGPFTACFNQYLRTSLNWESHDTYEVLSDVQPWNFGKVQNEYLNVSSRLKEVMNRNPDLKVFVASGAYDLAIPYFATDYTFNHLDLDPAIKGNITMSYYEAGHMMYTHLPSLIKMRSDLGEFYKNSMQ